jgi:hypothetical protein
MAKKPDKEERKQLTVCVQYVAAPNAKDRLSRAINILLNSVPRNTPQQKLISSSIEKKPPRSAIAEVAEGHTTNRDCDHKV